MVHKVSTPVTLKLVGGPDKLSLDTSMEPNLVEAKRYRDTRVQEIK